MDPLVRAGLGAEKASRALFFIYSKIAVPGECALGACLNTFLRLTGDAEKDLFFLRPIGSDANP